MVARTRQNRKRLLLAVNAVLLAAIGVTCAVILMPIEEDSGPPSVRERPVVTPTDRPAVKPLSSYAAIYSRDVRQPLYDPEPKRVVKVKKPEPTLRLKVTGTVVETGASYAFLRTARGEDRMASVGEVIDDATLLAITPEGVTVRFHGREIELTMDEKQEARR